MSHEWLTGKFSKTVRSLDRLVGYWNYFWPRHIQTQEAYLPPSEWHSCYSWLIWSLRASLCKLSLAWRRFHHAEWWGKSMCFIAKPNTRYGGLCQVRAKQIYLESLKHIVNHCNTSQQGGTLATLCRPLRSSGPCSSKPNRWHAICSATTASTPSKYVISEDIGWQNGLAEVLQHLSTANFLTHSPHQQLNCLVWHLCQKGVNIGCWHTD